MQTTAQATDQKPKREYNFKPGKSGNVSGQTARQRHAAALTEKFLHTHGRVPDVVEVATIKNVAAMMAKSCAVSGVSAEDLVRLSNSIDRLVARLGLAPKPGAAKPAHVPMRDRMAAAARSQQTHPPPPKRLPATV